MRPMGIVYPLILTLTFMLGTTMVAQEAQGPHEAMAKFDVILGNWQGSGTARMSAQGEAMPWTAKSTVKKILGGHFVQEDVSIGMGPEMPPMQFRTIYGWDNQTKRCVQFSCGNMGAFSMHPIYWTKDGKMIAASASVEEGKVVTERWVTEFAKDTSSFKGYRSDDGGDPYVGVEGTMKRGGDGFAGGADLTKVAMAPPSDKVSVLAPMAGNWSFKGSMVMQPGAPWTDISARERIQPILGGHVYYTDLKGDPIKEMPDFPIYEAQSYMGWDAQKNCLASVGMNNMGEIHYARIFPLAKDKIAMVLAGMVHGAPSAMRNIMEFTADGNEVKVHSHATMKDHDPIPSFKGSMTRVKP